MNRIFFSIKLFLLVQLSINCFSSVLPMQLGLEAFVPELEQGSTVKGLNFDQEPSKLPDDVIWADLERLIEQQSGFVHQESAQPLQIGFEAAEEEVKEPENNGKDAKQAQPAEANKVAHYAKQIKKCLIKIYGEKLLKRNDRGDILKEALTKITGKSWNKDREFKKLTAVAYFHGIDTAWYDKIRAMTKKVAKARADTTRRLSIFFNINLGLALAKRYPFDKQDSIEYVMAGCMLIILLKKQINLSMTAEQAIQIIDEMWDLGGKEVSDLKMNGRTLRYLLHKKYHELNHFNPNREKNKQASAALKSVLEKMERDFSDEYEAWEDKGW